MCACVCVCVQLLLLLLLLPLPLCPPLLSRLSLPQAEQYMPILLGLGQSQSLHTVRLESPRVTITDTAYHLACTALRNNTALRSLSLAQWEFSLQVTLLASSDSWPGRRSWVIGFRIDIKVNRCIGVRV